MSFDPGCGRNCELELVADDGRCRIDASRMTVTIADRTPPLVTEGRADLRCAWPPNGRTGVFGRDEFAPEITDACDPAPAWRLAGCSAQEDGVDIPDAAAQCGVSPDGSALWVRARRSGGASDGRQYGVLVSATDACGNESAPTLIGFVHVPHDARPATRCRP